MYNYQYPPMYGGYYQCPPCDSKYPPMPEGVCCPTQQNQNTFDYYESNQSARDSIVASQQGGIPDYMKLCSPYQSTMIAGCNPPLLQIQDCMNKKSWTTIISPTPGGTRARMVYINAINQQPQDPQFYEFYGYEIVKFPGGVLVLRNLIEYGMNICAIVPCI